MFFCSHINGLSITSKTRKISRNFIPKPPLIASLCICVPTEIFHHIHFPFWWGLMNKCGTYFLLLSISNSLNNNIYFSYFYSCSIIWWWYVFTCKRFIVKGSAFFLFSLFFLFSRCSLAYLLCARLWFNFLELLRKFKMTEGKVFEYIYLYKFYTKSLREIPFTWNNFTCDNWGLGIDRRNISIISLILWLFRDIEMKS